MAPSSFPRFPCSPRSFQMWRVPGFLPPLAPWSCLVTSPLPNPGLPCALASPPPQPPAPGKGNSVLLVAQARHLGSLTPPLSPLPAPLHTLRAPGSGVRTQCVPWPPCPRTCDSVLGGLRLQDPTCLNFAAQSDCWKHKGRTVGLLLQALGGPPMSLRGRQFFLHPTW